MARVYLQVEEALTKEFVDRQDGSIRYIQAQIQGEVVTRVGSGAKVGGVEEDFQALVVDQLLRPNEPTFIILALDTEGADGHVKWVLITYIPDLSPVRYKMLYSSSRDDLKRALGLAFFVGDFNANALEEVSYAALQQAISKSPIEDAPLSMLEKLVMEEKGLEKDTSIRSTAMGVLPFELLAEAKEALTSLPTGPNNWVELKLDSQRETVGLVSCKHVSLTSQTLPPLIPEDDARFFVIKGAASSSTTTAPSLTLIFSCPESAPIRQKMTYSTAKAALVASASALGLTLDKVGEIRQASDIVAALGLDGTGEGDEGGNGGVIKHTLTHAKPTRPGRGRARLIKKADTGGGGGAEGEDSPLS